MNNYQYCTQFALTRACAKPEFSVLDYGCGAGQIVKLMRAAGLDAYGCDVYYEGGDVSGTVPSELLGSRVLQMTDGRIPFGDAAFDLVISNQVMEHVPDLDAVLCEIARVLKPGGTCLSLFPHLECWWEGHCNIPLLHRLPRGKLRVYYAAALRSLGLGYFIKDMTALQWANMFCGWIDAWCYYRPLRQIELSFARHLSKPEHIDTEWLVSRKAAFRLAPVWLRRLITRKAAGLVFLTAKPGD